MGQACSRDPAEVSALKQRADSAEKERDELKNRLRAAENDLSASPKLGSSWPPMGVEQQQDILIALREMRDTISKTFQYPPFDGSELADMPEGCRVIQDWVTDANRNSRCKVLKELVKNGMDAVNRGTTTLAIM